MRYVWEKINKKMEFLQRASPTEMESLRTVHVFQGFNCLSWHYRTTIHESQVGGVFSPPKSQWIAGVTTVISARVTDAHSLSLWEYRHQELNGAIEKKRVTNGCQHWRRSCWIWISPIVEKQPNKWSCSDNMLGWMINSLLPRKCQYKRISGSTISAATWNSFSGLCGKIWKCKTVTLSDEL